jgi:hypothetical protein
VVRTWVVVLLTVAAALVARGEYWHGCEFELG